MKTNRSIPPGSLYAYVEGVEFGREGTVLIDLDAVPANQVRPLADIGGEPYQALAELRTLAVRLMVCPTGLKGLRRQELPLSEGSWLSLRFGEGMPLLATVSDALTEDNLGATRADLGVVSPTEVALIRSSLVLPPESPTGAIGGLLSSTHRTADAFVAVYDVGQGFCGALCEDPSQHPLLYFDFGCGCGCHTNSHTRPAHMSFCFKHAPPIVLSHWDSDHFMGAHMLDKGALKVMWLAPNQANVKPTAVKFASQLHLTGNILIWPCALGSVRTPWGEIRKCTGNTLNTSGLACVVELPMGGAVQSQFRVLIPGDAGYTDIPRLAGTTFDALVVSHHGGVASGTVPTPSQCACQPFVLPYGIQNTYRHPGQRTVASLLSAGWNHRLDTPSGNIGLEKQSAGGAQLTCCSKGCDLGVVQV